MSFNRLYATLGVLAMCMPVSAQQSEFIPAPYAVDAYAKPDYEGFVTPRNAFGQPEMSGVWSNGTTTPFQRPTAYGNRLVLSEEQAQQVQGAAEQYRMAGDAQTDPDAGPPTDGNTDLGYNRFWTDPGTQVMRVGGEPRSSLITTTPDGRVPPRRADAPPPPLDPRFESSEFNDDQGRNGDPEARGLSERCIFFPTSAGAVLRPVLYNNNYLIQQGRDSVAIMTEMINDVRVVRLDAEHRDKGMRQWMGDPVGWYEGDTLVVKTKDYHPHQPFYGASDQLTLTERFTRVANNRLLYEFMVEDPVTWEEPWGGEYEMWSSNGIYEYACHEGNRGLYYILAGGRAEEERARQEQEQAQ